MADDKRQEGGCSGTSVGNQTSPSIDTPRNPYQASKSLPSNTVRLAARHTGAVADSNRSRIVPHLAVTSEETGRRARIHDENRCHIAVKSRVTSPVISASSEAFVSTQRHEAPSDRIPKKRGRTTKRGRCGWIPEVNDGQRRSIPYECHSSAPC